MTARRAGGGESVLKPVLGAGDLVTLTLGMVIGSGIFLVPGMVLRQVGGSVPLAAAVWIVAGVLSVLGAMSYAELGISRPTTGGLYVYLREVFGERVAFLFGWTMFLVIGSGTIAAASVAFGAYLAELLPLSLVEQRIASVMLIAAIAINNVLGTRSSMYALTLATAAKVGGILAMSALLYCLGNGLNVTAWPPSAASSSSGFALAMVSALWAYEGWQWVLFNGGEVRSPQRNVPRGFVIGTLALVGIYLAANGAYLAALGPGRMAQSTRVAAQALTAVHRPLLAKLIAALILTSITAAANATLMTTSRVYYAMARDGLFFRAAGVLSPTRGIPTRALLASATWAAILALSGTFEQLLSYVVSFGWVFYALGAACVFGYRRQQPNLFRPYRVPGYPVTPALFIAAAAAVVVAAAVRQPREASIGLVVLGVGAVVHRFWHGTAADSVSESENRL
jgi:basic amino acid/polyamine antiporter, APA family